MKATKTVAESGLRVILVLSLALGASLHASELSSAEASSEESSQEKASSDTEAPLTVDELLAREPSDADYGIEPVRCIPTSRIKSSEVLGDKHVAFKMRGDEYYLVQFERRCMGLEKNGGIIMESGTLQLCRLDRIRGFRRSFGGMNHGVPCTIPGFQKITKQELVFVKEALKEERERKAEARKRVQAERRRRRDS